MVQTWWNHYWALSEAMLRIQAFFSKSCALASIHSSNEIPMGRMGSLDPHKLNMGGLKRKLKSKICELVVRRHLQQNCFFLCTNF